jgi:hypothetical protein
MRKVLFAFVLAAFTASLAVMPVTVSAKHDNDGMKHRKCPRGYHWVGGRHGHCVPRQRDRY